MLPQLHRTNVLVERVHGSNLKDSNEHNHLWISTIFGHFLIQSHSVASADEESQLVLLEFITDSFTPHFFCPIFILAMTSVNLSTATLHANKLAAPGCCFVYFC